MLKKLSTVYYRKNIATIVKKIGIVFILNADFSGNNVKLYHFYYSPRLHL